jgi:hypothetical protein
VAAAAVIDRAPPSRTEGNHHANSIDENRAGRFPCRGAVRLRHRGQDFTAPANVAGIDTFRHGAAAADAAQLPKDWWSIYGDATLNRLEEARCRTTRA